MKALRSILALVVAASCVAATDGQRIRRRLRLQGPAGGGSVAGLLTTNKLSCDGVFLTFNLNDADGPQLASGHAGIAFKHVSGSDHQYYAWTGDGHVYQFAEPATLSACNSTLSSLSYATITQDWGTFTVHNNAEGTHEDVPGQPNVAGVGLYYDATLDNLIPSWAQYYSNIPHENTFARLSFNTGSHTLTTVGCYMIDVPASLVGTGLVEIPASFLSTYSLVGKRWGVGLSSAYGATVTPAQFSAGPVIRAIAPPGSNACASMTNYDVGASATILSQFLVNAAGPTCYNFDGTAEPSGHNMGCGTTAAPGTPHPMPIAETRYSIDQYQFDWEPYGGHGWFWTFQFFPVTWYDDGVLGGVVVPTEMLRGWAKTPVLASPAPTMSYPNGTMRIDTNTHDSAQMRVGDYIWIPTCDPNNPAHSTSPSNLCEFVNNKLRSDAAIDSLSNCVGTVCDVAFHILISDTGNGVSGYVPQVGMDVYFGAVYAKAQPKYSRGTLRLGIINPTQLGEVALGTRQPYDVTFAEDIDLSTLAPGFGSGMTPPRFNSVTGSPNDNIPIAIWSDPTDQKIRIAFLRGKNGAAAIYRYSVAH